MEHQADISRSQRPRPLMTQSGPSLRAHMLRRADALLDPNRSPEPLSLMSKRLGRALEAK